MPLNSRPWTHHRQGDALYNKKNCDVWFLIPILWRPTYNVYLEADKVAKFRPRRQQRLNRPAAKPCGAALTIYLERWEERPQIPRIMHQHYCCRNRRYCSRNPVGVGLLRTLLAYLAYLCWKLADVAWESRGHSRVGGWFGTSFFGGS